MRGSLWLVTGLVLATVAGGAVFFTSSAGGQSIDAGKPAETGETDITQCGVADDDQGDKASTKQAIVWTSGDPDVAHRMVLMYCSASHKSRWFDEHQLIVWGPSARLLAGDKDLQQKVKQLVADGVDVKACIVCASSYGVTADLKKLGIDVKPMGRPLANLQQSGWHMLTF